MDVPRFDLNEGAAIAVISFAVLETFKVYRDTAPSLQDVRAAKQDDWQCAQQLLDADVLTGIVVVLMGMAGVILLNKRYPLVFLVLTWVCVAGYYHAVRKGPNSYHQAVKEGRL
jgi:hypothetical protein